MAAFSLLTASGVVSVAHHTGPHQDSVIGPVRRQSPPAAASAARWCSHHIFLAECMGILWPLVTITLVYKNWGFQYILHGPDHSSHLIIPLTRCSLSILLDRGTACGSWRFEFKLNEINTYFFVKLGRLPVDNFANNRFLGLSRGNLIVLCLEAFFVLKH